MTEEEHYQAEIANLKEYKKRTNDLLLKTYKAYLSGSSIKDKLEELIKLDT